MPMRLSPLSALSRSALVTRLLPRRVRMRLTLLYGGLFVASGAVLLGITYLLVLRTPKKIISIEKGGSPRVSTGAPGTGRERLDGFSEKLREQAESQHGAQMHDLLVQSGIALLITTFIAIAIGWLVAGRVLRPLRMMTSTIRKISARNVHKRLDVTGPADELKDLADTVDGLLGRLEAALDSHKRFVANAAHELRTPLTLERALLEETLMDHDATLESFRANFERLLNISDQQGCLLESLLTLSSSERGLERQDELDLAEIAERVLLVSRPEMERKGLSVEPALQPARIEGDSALVERLVANLVDNAADYNVPGGRVEIVTRVAEGRPVVSVSNTGPEVPADQVDRLFEPFQRLRRTAGDGHHGLGLSIVRAIATAHGAALSADARPSGGLVVEAVFPLGESPSTSGEHDNRNAERDTAPRDGSFLVRLPKRDDADAKVLR
ncbi:HAMP domain-containing protein [Streptomyces daliensis]|uniref:histidine kinase n=1 Tax=Streptomyces daliensis TaxID=299421 RepID=A0A8T4IQ92_9ACTN|nr:HAMP domain-containing protein [Streptomyces daliensis]